MAKKLYGAAKAARDRKRARTRPTALARRAPSSPARRRSSSLERRRRAAPLQRRRSRRSGGGGRSVVAVLKRKAPELIAGSLYAYATSGASPTAQKIQATIRKVPVIAAIGAPATHGILLTVIACNTKGKLSQISDYFATAALHRAAWNLGAVGFDREKMNKLSGDDLGYDDDVLLGGVNGDEYEDADYE